MTEARKKANKKYLETKCDNINLRVPKGKKEKIKQYASNNGESLNAYINRLINTDMETKKLIN